MAQIAITALSLVDLSSTHWTARGLVTFSLVASLVSVHCAGAQHRVMGRCLSASHIQDWIENSTDGMRSVGESWNDLRRNPKPRKIPAASSILTMSAPVMLLSASLNAFLAGFGVYLGFTWVKDLDEAAGGADSHKVFLVYTIGLAVCYGFFMLSEYVSQIASTDGFELECLLKKANPWTPTLLDFLKAEAHSLGLHRHILIPRRQHPFICLSTGGRVTVAARPRLWS